MRNWHHSSISVTSVPSSQSVRATSWNTSDCTTSTLYTGTSDLKLYSFCENLIYWRKFFSQCKENNGFMPKYIKFAGATSVTLQHWRSHTCGNMRWCTATSCFAAQTAATWQSTTNCWWDTTGWSTQRKLQRKRKCPASCTSVPTVITAPPSNSGHPLLQKLI